MLKLQLFSLLATDLFFATRIGLIGLNNTDFYPKHTDAVAKNSDNHCHRPLISTEKTKKFVL